MTFGWRGALSSGVVVGNVLDLPVGRQALVGLEMMMYVPLHTRLRFWYQQNIPLDSRCFCLTKFQAPPSLQVNNFWENDTSNV